ncbi:MAG: ABC transporter permease [Kofleriaceae bacterium]|nr:ABC transporter permease [Kofleriaceae bacterium]MCB9573206.1 ABC transporter permease [Kofleriaceae bacterium]
MLGPGFQSFVAWRYLMARPRQVSRPLLAIAVGLVLGAALTFGLAEAVLSYFKDHSKLQPFNRFVAAMSPIHEYDALGVWLMRGAGAFLLAAGAGLAFAWRGGRTVAWSLIVAGIVVLGFGIAFHWMIGEVSFVEVGRWAALIMLVPLPLLLVLGVLRYFFSFFTTVSVAGVFIGSMALVVVLSVMSGFESDLRVKILGSNAHIRVTRDEGGIEDWLATIDQLKAVPGVVAVTPYATSEVVLSANNNYASVIIKGIDPDTVGGVTDLVKDLEEPSAMQRLYPLAHDDLDQTVEHPDDGGGDGGDAGVTDPAPGDMPTGTDPIDFSGGDDDPDDAGPGDGGAATDPSAADDGDPAAGPVTTPDAAAADARAAAPVDPAPADFAIGEPADPEDLSGDAGGYDDDAWRDLGDQLHDDVGGMQLDRAPEVLAVGPRDGGRIALLDGVLVGKELVKQLHLYTGQEVRLVSPLADPSNPDATGSPIPFHRDYRVAGVFYTGMYEYDLKFVYVTIDSLQDFLQTGDTVDGIEIRIADPEDTGAVGARIRKALGAGYSVQDWKELNRNLFSALKLEKIAMFLVLAIIILVASFSIIGNLIMVVVEKGKEIALLKTLGATDQGVMRIFVMQGFFIGAVGTLSGVVTGLIVCWACARWGFPINPDVYYIDKLPIHVDMPSVALIGTAGLLISVVATIYPALIAARLRPAVGLRHE